MSDPNDVWQNSAPQDNGSYSPRRGDDGGRSPPPPRRDRSRSPGQRNGAAGERGRTEDRGPDPGTNQGNNLHVSGLARSVDNRLLDDLFGKHGKVYKAEIMFDPHTQESRGFGFVKMMTADDAQACIDALNGMNLEGKVLTVAHARRGRARTPTPGRYHGVKVELGAPRGYGGDRPYQPRSYDSRYSDRGPPPSRYDDRRYDDRRDYERRYDDRRDYGRDGRDRYDDRDARGPPPADRDYYYRSERDRYDRRDERPRYDEPRGQKFEERPRY